MVIPCKIFLTILFTALQVLVYSQTVDYDGSQPKPVTKSNVYEIEYQPIVMLGFSYFHNFGNKFVPGVGFKIGPGVFYYANPYFLGSDFIYNDGFLPEVLDIELKARDIFSKQKLSGWYSYDFGINYTIVFSEDWEQFLGAKFAFNVKIIKVLRLGLSVRVGDSLINGEKGLLIFLNPNVVISF